MKPLAERDLNHILNHTRDLWQEMRGERFFVTGGTGFFGSWLLESFLWINRELKLGAGATILSRSPDAFFDRMPHLAGRPELRWIKGDVTNFDFPEGDFPFVIHAATEASAKLTRENPRQMYDTIVDGTRRTLDFARSHGTRKLLLTSSGAVYGKQPTNLTHLPEDFTGGPNPLDPLQVYGEGKRAAEMQCAVAATNWDCEIKIARCFAFVGPRLPLDAHFAIGNFIRDGMQGGPIVIKGDGTPQRSYLYAADLVVWLWTILFKGRALRPYNVGSDESISIRDLANKVSGLVNPPAAVQVLGKPDPDRPVERYVPDISRAKSELGLEVCVPLESGIRYTLEYCHDI